jgi:hypothetical protein
MTREKIGEICYSFSEPRTGFGVVRLHRLKVNMGERWRVRGWVRGRCVLGSLGSPLAADFSAAEMALGTTYRNHSV